MHVSKARSKTQDQKNKEKRGSRPLKNAHEIFIDSTISSQSFNCRPGIYKRPIFASLVPRNLEDLVAHTEDLAELEAHTVDMEAHMADMAADSVEVQASVEQALMQQASRSTVAAVSSS